MAIGAPRIAISLLKSLDVLNALAANGEWVNPTRGGSSENERITFAAAPGESVRVSGAERYREWKRTGEVFLDAQAPYKKTSVGAVVHPTMEPRSPDPIGSMAGWSFDRVGSHVVTTAISISEFSSKLP